MSQTHFSSLASSPQALAAAPSGPAWLAFLRRGLQRVDGWFASPLSAQQLVLRAAPGLALLEGRQPAGSIWRARSLRIGRTSQRASSAITSST